jgi:hypothetical protein
MSAIKPKLYFMEHEQPDFETQILLGRCHYGAADVGEILATSSSGLDIPKRFTSRWFVQRPSFGSRLRRGPIGIASPRPAVFMTSACSIGWL